ncbi:MAG: ABC transporter ATP-binding protein [Candidatus Methanofastidiosa archaeon]|nr:ABC transporter ATP-binding protein [Candidatus Methanofastidiosa archaeon]
MNAAMSVSGLTFGYGESPVFADLSFSVEKGSILCILGPNGTGKSTLIKCLAGLLAPQGGAVEVDGTPLFSLRAHERARRIGYVPQAHSSTFPYTVLDMVSLGRAPHLGLFAAPSAADYGIARASLEAVGILHLGGRPSTEISGGELQLALIARVLTQQPNILLLDEPTAHLDFGNQMRILSVVRRLSRDGMTVVMSSHFPDHAFVASDTVAIMRDRSFKAMGAPEEVITDESMKETYGIGVRVTDVPGIVRRKVCVPLMDEKS